jgi:monoamine oxidase
MPRSRFNQKTKRYRAALVEARATGVDPDDLFAHSEAAYEEVVSRSLDRSSDLAGTGDLAQEHAHAILRGDEHHPSALTRREFLSRAAILGGVAVAAPLVRAAATTEPRVVVVGAGFAGLTAAYRIQQLRGWHVDVYEAQDRVGGRARTIRTLAHGQYTEAGPSGISSNEDVIQGLLRELGLWPMVDTWLRYPGGQERYWFQGKFWTWAQLKDGIAQIHHAGSKAWEAIGRRIPTFDDINAAARSYDAMSVADFLNTQTDHGTSTPAGAYIANDFGVEYGGSAELASSIQQILEEGTIWGGGGYDERYAVPGGNDTLAATLKKRLQPGSLHLGHQLVAIEQGADGGVVLTFDTGGGATATVVADKAILTLPVTTLRDVDRSAAGFGSVTERWIVGEALGNTTKFNFQFHGQPWKLSNSAGDGVSDLVTQSVWQASYLARDPSVLIFMNNRDYGDTPAHSTATGAVLSDALASVDTIFPGSAAKVIAGQTYIDNWPADPWVKGTYAYTPPGGFASFDGIQGTRQGNVHFAGEATAAYIHTGTMNGAVESGYRVAREVT